MIFLTFSRKGTVVFSICSSLQFTPSFPQSGCAGFRGFHLEMTWDGCGYRCHREWALRLRGRFVTVGLVGYFPHIF